MGVQLGNKPSQLTVYLTTGDAFAARLLKADGTDWDDGTTVNLVLGSTPFAATVDGPALSWHIDAATWTTAIAGDLTACALTFGSGASKVTIGAGLVVLNSNTGNGFGSVQSFSAPGVPSVTVQPIVGPAGPGVIGGGAAGSVLAKASTADFDTAWVALGSASTHAAADFDSAGAAATAQTAAAADATTKANNAQAAAATDAATKVAAEASARDAAITAAVADLVDGAPGALDTLHELADALGDDQNYAATITTALASKAPLASPAFTGSPTINGVPAGTQTVLDLRSFGAVGAADDKATIDAALTAASTAGKATLVFPAGLTVNTSGGHVVPRNVHIVARGAVINHTGNNTCFTFQSTSAFDVASRNSFEGYLIGNSGASAVGIEVGNQWGFRTGPTTLITGYASGVGILLNNVTNWTEGCRLAGMIRGCATGLRLQRSTGTNSFAYTKLDALGIDVPASGVGIDIGGTSSSQCRIYNGDLRANIWLDGNNATALNSSAQCLIDNCLMSITGEVLNSSTGCIAVASAGGGIKGYGYLAIAGASNSVSSGTIRVMPLYRPNDTISGTDGTGTFSAMLSDNPDVSHTAQFGAYVGTNIDTPYVAAYDQSTDCFKIYKVPFGSSPSAGTLICRVDKNGAIYPGGGTTGVLQGAGSPESSVTAGPGSIYLRNNGSGDSQLWVKIIGTGTTGWHQVRARNDLRIVGEGLLGEAFPRFSTQGQFSPASGTMWGSLIGLDVNDRITNVCLVVETAGSGLTLCKVAVMSKTGTLIQGSADISSSLTSVGAKQFALSSSYLAPAPDANVYLAILQVGTTPAKIRVGATVPTASEMNGFGAGLPPAASFGTGLSDVPGTSTVAAYTTAPWLGFN